MNINNLDLNKLKCFQAVAQERSLQAGAKKLSLTTSAVYQAIKKLEDDIKLHLFYRTGKKYVLTEEGKKLQDIFQNFLWDLTLFQESSKVGENELSGEIRIGLPLNFSKQVFLPILKDFMESYPGVQFNLEVAETRRSVEAISRFELDLAITDDSIPKELQSKISAKEIFKEELVMVCSIDFAKKYRQELDDIKAIKNLPHLGYAKDLPLIQRWYKNHYRRQVKISHFHIIDNVESMLMALNLGLGVGIVPKDMAKARGRIAGDKVELNIIEFRESQLFNHLFMVQSLDYVPSTRVKKFLDHFTKSLAKKIKD